MPEKLSDNEFRSLAKKAVVGYWNGSQTLSKKFGKINARKVYLLLQKSTTKKHKAVMSVTFDSEKKLFEFVWSEDTREGCLNVYKMQHSKTVKA